MGKELAPAKVKPLDRVRGVIEESRDRIMKLVQDEVKYERLYTIAVQCAAANPEIITCEPVSIAASIVNAAMLRLEPLPTLRQAALVPLKGWCHLWVMANGWRQLSLRSKQIYSFDAQPVFENDAFDFQYGSEPFLRHKPIWPKSTRGELIGAYAICYFPNGKCQFKFLDEDKIAELRACSKSGSTFWGKWPEEMREAKASKALVDYLEISTEDMKRAVILDNQMEQEGRQEIPFEKRDLDADASRLLEARTQQVTGASNGAAIDKSLISEEAVTSIKDIAHKAGIPLDTVANALLDITTEAKDMERSGAHREEVYAFAQQAAKTLYKAYAGKLKQKTAKKAEAKAAPKEPPQDPGTKKAPEPDPDLAENPWMAELDGEDPSEMYRAPGDADQDEPPPPDDEDAPPEDELTRLSNLFG